MLDGTLVRLRAMERADLKRQWEFNNSLETELAGGGDPPIPQSFERLAADYDQSVGKGGRNGSSFAIEADGKFIGQCALFNDDLVGRTSEIGITIGDKDYLGRGYGRDAIQVLVEYAFTFRNLRKLWLRVHAMNERARRSYTSCGFSEEGRLRSHVWSNGAFDDLIIMGLLVGDWTKRKSDGAKVMAP
jgi:RimJ/RimL family protein N-acetyltransferase